MIYYLLLFIGGVILSLGIHYMYDRHVKIKRINKKIRNIRKDIQELNGMKKNYYNIKYYLLLETDILDNYTSYKDYPDLHFGIECDVRNKKATPEAIREEYNKRKEEK